MKLKIKTAMICVLLATGAAIPAGAQSNLVQTLNFNLTAYDTASGATVKIATKDVIRFFAGTNVPSGQLWLVTPMGNAAGTTGDLNAFLRVTSGGATVVEVPSPDSFNLFQDSASVVSNGTKIASRAINRFSIDFGQFHAELQGFSSWNISTKPVNGADVSGSGSFSSTVSGEGTVDGVTQTGVPIKGTVTAGPPKPGS